MALSGRWMMGIASTCLSLRLFALEKPQREVRLLMFVFHFVKHRGADAFRCLKGSFLSSYDPFAGAEPFIKEKSSRTGGLC